MPVLSQIILHHYGTDKGNAEKLYNLYKSNQSDVIEISVRTVNHTYTYILKNPKGWEKAPTEVRLWVRNKKTNEDVSYFSIFGLTKTLVGQALGAISDEINKLPPHKSEATTIAQPSSIELKTIQIRRFEKSPGEIIEAINEYFSDKNGRCSLQPPRFAVMGAVKSLQINGSNTFVVDGYVANKGRGNCHLGKEKYEIEISATPPQKTGNDPLLYDRGMLFGKPTLFKLNETVVRIRIKLNENQIFDARRYQEIFKNIADQAFVEALNIDPILIE